MGIRGLMTYVRKHPNLLENYFLHGEYLVIDGHNLAHKLYGSGCGNTAFGGDYDVYPRTVEEFFDELQKCKVESLVILDGGYKVVDLPKTIKRKEWALEPIAEYTVASRNKMQVVPMSLMLVFQSVLKKKNVKMVRCLVETDSNIAGVAKALNCSVLSFDSKFFLCGVQCIPIDSLQPSVRKSFLNEGSWGKECKVYKPDAISKSFRGLSISMVPLLNIILGNSYMDSTIFEQFLSSLRCPRYPIKRLYNDEQRNIEATLLWLQVNNIHEAINKLLEEIPEERRQEVKRIIENVIDEHINLPCDLLKTLGFKKEYEAAVKTKLDYKKFELLDNIDDNEKKKKTWREEKTFESENSEEEKEEAIKIRVYNDMGKRNDAIVNSWPSWFTREFENAETPSYYVNLMLHRFFDVIFHLEIWSYPSAMEMSLKIVRVIDGLLIAGQQESSLSLLILTREGKKIVTRLVDPLHGTKSTIFPPLSELRKTTMEIRKQIFEDTLEMSREEIEDFPDEWKLFVAVILFWMGQKDEPLRYSHHMKAAIFMMLFGVIDKNIGYHRSLFALRGPTEEIVENEQVSVESEGEKKGDSIKDALNKVTKKDCLNAAPFFIENFWMHRSLHSCPGNFNAMTVHIFIQFEACLRHAINLNRLLECPYEEAKIEQLCNGTLYYNLCQKFESEPNVENFIATTLKQAPSLLRLVNLLMTKAQMILDARSKV